MLGAGFALRPPRVEAPRGIVTSSVIGLRKPRLYSLSAAVLDSNTEIADEILFVAISLTVSEPAAEGLIR